MEKVQKDTAQKGNIICNRSRVQRSARHKNGG